jgi:RHS repeat-associated protein
MRAGGVIYYLHGDHLGSTSLATTASGAVVPGSRTGYDPYGAVRYGGVLPTDFTYTGQRAEDFGLLDYRARYYDPALGRFVSADTVVPNPARPQDFNRYSYAANSPLRYSDPTGHQPQPPYYHEPPIDYDMYFPALQVAVVHGTAPGIERSPHWQAVSRGLDYGGLFLDVVQSAISVVGTDEGGTIVLSGGAVALLEPTSVGEAAVAVVGIGITLPADAVEDVPGSLSVILTALSDLAGGDTYWDRSTNELVIAQDTLVAGTTQIVDFLLPGSPVDLALNAHSLGYDLAGTFGNTSAFVEYRISFDEKGNPTLGYLVLYPRCSCDRPLYQSSA